jgi:hypothetical protein
VHRAFSAIGETRRLNKAGSNRFRSFLLYGERSLIGKVAVVTIFEDVLMLEHNEVKLPRHSAEWQPADAHLLCTGNPRLSDHPSQSLQMGLWEPGEVEWFAIIRTESTSAPPKPQRAHLRRGPPLPGFGVEGQERRGDSSFLIKEKMKEGFSHGNMRSHIDSATH